MNLYELAFRDLPQFMRPSDVEIHHLETARPLDFSKIVLVDEGPLRASVQAEVKYGKSTVKVTVSNLLSSKYYIIDHRFWCKISLDAIPGQDI